MLGEFQYDVFLSHSAQDKAVVRPLAERLRQEGLKVWWDERECPSPAGAGEGGRRPGEGRGVKGDSIPAKIKEGLEFCAGWCSAFGAAESGFISHQGQR